jgi:cGMP-dependent protein kinase
METDGVLAEINLEAFTECIGGQIEEVLKKNEKSHEVTFENYEITLRKK